MKKFTLYILIFFAGIVATILVMGLMFPNSQTNPKTNTSISVATSENPKINNFTTAEVATHNSKNDCYLIVNSQVYDVSSYINKHPGGVRKIVERCGQESSQAFATIHSNFAWNLLKDYYIGDLTK
ncbi:hypothetical protein KKG46_03500 [Patescibacteria group bacterium]|nr:hypothetical protein [Patescibacteria group bacterium]